MKKIIMIVLLICLFILIGCSRKGSEIESLKLQESVLFDSIDIVDNKNIELEKLNDLIKLNNTNLLKDFNDCKDDNNYLKLELLNKTACYISQDCTTCTRLLNKKEIELEKCWMYNKTCVINKTFIYKNYTLISLYDDCDNRLKIINESLN